VRLDELLPRLTAEGRSTVGGRLGILLARLAMMAMLRPGRFVDADLHLAPLPGGLVEFVQGHRSGTAIEDWSPEEYAGLLDVAEEAETHLDRVERACLVHGDLNPKNLLVDPVTLEVTGLLDWEFAYAGLPGTDLGNLLRFERDPVLTESVLGAFRERVPDAGPDLLDRARAADLYALVDLAGRRGENPVTDRAHALLLAVATTGDLHAVP
jgi:Ser/Thr protein kinase RdoA (MazF antagonist)